MARQIGKYEEAIADCTRSLEIDPDFVKVLLRRADLYLKMEKYQEAVNDLERRSSWTAPTAVCPPSIRAFAAIVYL